ncbi:MAG TPA: hypothetical protein VMX12_13165, partial [Acidimicrobiia bacterium]|nr:hypothetical protein [Acidimicrobiia bacterium]
NAEGEVDAAAWYHGRDHSGGTQPFCGFGFSTVAAAKAQRTRLGLHGTIVSVGTDHDRAMARHNEFLEAAKAEALDAQSKGASGEGLTLERSTATIAYVPPTPEPTPEAVVIPAEIAERVREALVVARKFAEHSQGEYDGLVAEARLTVIDYYLGTFDPAKVLGYLAGSTAYAASALSGFAAHQRAGSSDRMGMLRNEARLEGEAEGYALVAQAVARALTSAR